MMLVATTAHAQKALNHSSAVNGIGGCDEPGYPLTICKAGSYKLATDLRVPADSDGIVIQVSLVTLDLNGFSIYQNGGCGSGSGYGIRSAPALTALTVVNGTVSCHGGAGVSLLGGKHRVERVTAIANGAWGIIVGEDSRVENSNASENLVGMYTGGGCRVAGNTASANGLDGIFAGPGTLVFGNTARANARYGLFLSGAAYGNNVLAHNPGNPGNAIQIAGGVPMGPNVCIGAAPCQ
jgi:hypothetical protein